MFNFFKKEEKSKSLKEILKEFKNLKEEFEELSKKFGTLKKESRFYIQKIGIVRYNPFSEVGSDQSFSLALLNGNNDGIVITSLYAREGNRVYGKPVKNGSSEYLLSNEEKEAISKAIKFSLG